MQEEVTLSADQIRIRNLERRVATLETGIRELIEMVKQVEVNSAKRTLGALSMAFHNLSDHFSEIAAGPKAIDFEVVRVEEGTPGAIIVTREEDQFAFVNGDTREAVDGNIQPLVEKFLNAGILDSGETGWFHFMMRKEDDGHAPTDEAPASQRDDGVSA